MTVFTSGGRLHIWRECLPMRSHYAVKSVEVSSIEIHGVLTILDNNLCKRCRARLAHEGWPAKQ